MIFITCDRCGEKKASQGTWLHVSYYGNGDDMDLCQSCLIAIREWVKQ